MNEVTAASEYPTTFPMNHVAAAFGSTPPSTYSLKSCRAKSSLKIQIDTRPNPRSFTINCERARVGAGVDLDFQRRLCTATLKRVCRRWRAAKSRSYMVHGEGGRIFRRRRYLIHQGARAPKPTKRAIIYLTNHG